MTDHPAFPPCFGMTTKEAAAAMVALAQATDTPECRVIFAHLERKLAAWNARPWHVRAWHKIIGQGMPGWDGWL